MFNQSNPTSNSFDLMLKYQNVKEIQILTDDEIKELLASDYDTIDNDMELD